ncbi:DUF721 domain-containing protein [Pantoea sp. 1.19]|uniref:DUF721 domain-containing protein n=1 Tax=Pantoea sp. 1.19 TaxID=1925589 RepID=UPI000948FB73|nr:DciA family protein [Pantoea sp. 1.19]
MRSSRPHSLEHLFDETQDKSILRQVQQRAGVLVRLNRAVQGLLPATLHPWVRVANYRQGILVLEVANASWMMRLRYEQSALLSALRAEILPSLAAIDIRINPALAAKGEPTAQESSSQAEKKVAKRQLSAASAQSLRDVAERSPEKLRRIIERLASRAGEGTR